MELRWICLDGRQELSIDIGVELRLFYVGCAFGMQRARILRSNEYINEMRTYLPQA